MLYYYVWVRSERYRGNEPLTYQYPTELADGSIVQVALREDHVLGIVFGRTQRPRFATKSIEQVIDLPPLPRHSLALGRWLQTFYPAPIGIITQQLLPARIALDGNVPNGMPPRETWLKGQPNLTAEQQKVLNQIKPPDTYLLHGRTGSGKTRIYMELAARSLRAGRSALILSPEIGLTSQLATNLQTVFANQVVVLHSQLGPKERAAAWSRILLSTEPLVVTGPRSALFAPLRDIGMIVIDESHDQSYKQQQQPYYQTVRVASHLRQLHNAWLVLGSATPSVVDYYMAEQRHKPILRLHQIAVNSSAAKHITVVDMRDRSLFTRAAHLSLPLVQAMQSSLQRHEQSLLYLNRRGTARLLLCDHCGWQALCPHCDIALTYHGDTHSLRCHTCGYTQASVLSCPQCGNLSVSLRSFGTKAIVDEVHHLFPEARIMRFDSDNLKAERLEQQYEQIRDGKIDILVGTQMLAKGLDLPKLSTLGVVLADTSLYLPDFTAQERTFQLLNQVLGRIGRGHLDGQAFIQTFNPESSLLQTARDNDWNNFYNNELVNRKAYGFPPFCYLLKLSCRRNSAQAAETAAFNLKQKLLLLQPGIVIEGPAPAFHERVGKKYYWQLVVKSRNRSKLLEVVTQLPAAWTYDLDPTDLL